MEMLALGFALLSALTLVIGVGILAAWRASGSVHFVIGLSLTYYYSLFGAWKILELRQTGRSDNSLEHLEASLFPVRVDENYLTAMALYGLFNLTLAATVLLAASRDAARFCRLQQTSWRIDHLKLLLVSLLCLLASVAIQWQGIRSAIESGVSAYSVTRTELTALYSLHLLCNRIGLAALAISIGARFADTSTRHGWGIGSAGLALVWVLFLLVIGNRNELLMAGIAGALWYSCLGGGFRVPSLAGFALLGFVALRLIEATRGLGVEGILSDLGSVLLSADFWDPLALATGSESLAAHISLYGILAQGLDLTYGSSILYLLASVVPQVMVSERPPDIYTIYAHGVSALETQGFNIHYAAGWYLNFGLVGVVVGATILGGIWVALLHQAGRRLPGGDRMQLSWQAAFCFAAAFAPAMMRNGPEGIKGLVVEAVLIPFLLTGFALQRKDAAVAMSERGRERRCAES